MINGVDVSDPTRAFSGDEWWKLGPGGQQYVRQCRGTGSSGPNTNQQVAAVNGAGVDLNPVPAEAAAPAPTPTAIVPYGAPGTGAPAPAAGRGAQHGRGLGRGAHMPQS